MLPRAPLRSAARRARRNPRSPLPGPHTNPVRAACGGSRARVVRSPFRVAQPLDRRQRRAVHAALGIRVAGCSRNFGDFAASGARRGRGFPETAVSAAGLTGADAPAGDAPWAPPMRGKSRRSDGGAPRSGRRPASVANNCPSRGSYSPRSAASGGPDRARTRPHRVLAPPAGSRGARPVGGGVGTAGGRWHGQARRG
jgi:hypothetical protein